MIFWGVNEIFFLVESMSMFKLKPNHIGLTLHTYLVDYSRNKKTKQPSLLASSNIQVLWIFEVSFSLYYMELNIGLVGIHNRLNIRQSLYTYVRTM